MKRLIALLALAASCAAHADLVVGVHTVSYHFAASQAAGSRGWNNVNPGVYVRYNGWTAGIFRNSLYRTSTYAGYTFGQGMFSLTVGAVTGYDKVVADGTGDHRAVRCAATCREVDLRSTVSLLLVPSVKFKLTEAVSARLALLAAPGCPPVVHLMLEHRF